MSRVSPTQRTLAAYRKRGYRAQVVERWVAQARRRIDLFGFIDGLAIICSEDAHGGPLVYCDDLECKSLEEHRGKYGVIRGIVGFQATTGTHLADHLYKIQHECEEQARDWLNAGGRIELWAWRSLSPRGTKLVRWKPIVVGLTLGDKGQIVESYREM